MLRPRDYGVCVANSGLWGDVNGSASVSPLDACAIVS